MNVMPAMVKVHWGCVNSGRDEGFRYSRGNPAIHSKLDLIMFNNLSPIAISGFVKYLWIKKADTNEHLRLMGLRLSTLPLGVLAKPWHEKAIISFMSNQAKYSLYYHQYKEYILTF